MSAADHLDRLCKISRRPGKSLDCSSKYKKTLPIMTLQLENKRAAWKWRHSLPLLQSRPSITEAAAAVSGSWLLSGRRQCNS